MIVPTANYPTSRDYRQLWELAHTAAIVCIVDMDHGKADTCRDIARTVHSPEWSPELVQVGSRGIGHIWAESLEAFIAGCEQCNLEWLVPPAALGQLEGNGPTAVEIRNMWLACNNPGVFARSVLARWGNLPVPLLEPEKLTMTTNPDIYTDFRALCAELIKLDQELPVEYSDWKRRWCAASARVRFALAAEAPKEMDLEANFRTWYEDVHGSPYFGAMPLCVAIEWGQYLLQQAAPSEPEEIAVEVRELVTWLREGVDNTSDEYPDGSAKLARVATLLQQFSAITTEDLKND